MQAEYLQWAEANGFTPMLPKDAKQRMNKQSGSKQSRLDSHLQHTPLKPEEKVNQYSDKLFREALVRWIVETDQVTTYCRHVHDCSDVLLIANICCREHILQKHDQSGIVCA